MTSMAELWQTIRAEPRPCHTDDPDMWTSDHPALQARARELCATCSVWDACIQVALTPVRVGGDIGVFGAYGIWGGLDPDQRRAYAATMARPAVVDLTPAPRCPLCRGPMPQDGDPRRVYCSMECANVGAASTRRRAVAC